MISNTEPTEFLIYYSQRIRQGCRLYLKPIIYNQFFLCGILWVSSRLSQNGQVRSQHFHAKCAFEVCWLKWLLTGLRFTIIEYLTGIINDRLDLRIENFKKYIWWYIRADGAMYKIYWIINRTKYFPAFILVIFTDTVFLIGKYRA